METHFIQSQTLYFYVLMKIYFFRIEWRVHTSIGKLGEQPVDKALACLQNCPLLENLENWSHWTLLFAPQMGSIKLFIEKYGYMHTMDVKSELVI